MTPRFSLFVAALLLLGGEAAASRCRVRHPAAGALAARLQSADTSEARARGVFPRAAAERLETQTDVVDVLVAFDESAQRWLASHGKGSALDYARARVAAMNDVLGKTQLLSYFRFRLAGAVEFAADLSSPQVEMEDLLDYFVDGYGRVVARGAMSKVTDRREAVGADIVSVLTARGEYGTVGVGYSLEDEGGMFSPAGMTADEIVEFGDWAYNVCSIEAVDADYTLLHEIGHNMGAGHPDMFCADWRMISVGPQLYPYSAGYYVWKDGVGYYTVMSYNFGGLTSDGLSDPSYRFTPLPYFSSPDIYWEGVPVGTAWNDNRWTLAVSCGSVAQYRASKLAVGSEGVTDAENAAAESAYGGGATSVDPNRPVQVSGFTVKGPFRPAKGANAAFPWVGGVYSNGVAVGVVQLKVGKANLNRGESRIGGSVTLLDGKKHAVRTAGVPVGDGPRHVEGVEVKGLGTFSGWFGENGFAGTLEGTPFGTLRVRTQELDGRLFGSPAYFNLGASREELEAGGAGTVLQACLPTGEPVTCSANGTWSCRRAASVSYKGVKDELTGVKTWTLTGLDNPQAPNLSGLRLASSAKKSTFKGSFRLYYDVGTAERPKLKKAKVSVAGIVVGGEGRGTATLKGVGGWPVMVR